MDTKFLAGGFSGVLVGMYAQSSLSEKAAFEWFDYVTE